MKQFYTYLHCRPDGMPFYVGKGGGSNSERHHDFKWNRNKHHKNIIAKHGADNILVYIFHCDSEQQSLDDEIQQIAQLRREGYELVNMTDGGEGTSGLKHSAESRAKMSINSQGKNLGLKRSFETRAKVGAAKKGNKYCLGLKRPPEFGAAISARQLGKKPSPESVAKMVATKTGKSWSAARRLAFENSKFVNIRNNVSGQFKRR